MPNPSIDTDLLIIGAGPTGLFAVFEAGLLKMRCHLIDYLPQPGGQLSEIYPKKPIYDIPGLPSILAGDLVTNLMEQIAPFNPGFTLGERAESLEKLPDGKFRVITDRGTIHTAAAVAIAGGLGCFEPRKPPIESIAKYEDKGVFYIVKNPADFAGKRIVIAGGGDSALDWAIFLAESAAELVMIHRRSEFRGAPDSVEKVKELHADGKINLLTNAQVTGLEGQNKLESVTVSFDDLTTQAIATDIFLPLFGLSPKLGPIGEWGLQLDKAAIEVNTFDYSTNIPGIYAIGDINTYPGKLKLILCGFHEATLMVQSAFKLAFPDKKLSFKYTTVTGIEGITS
jgi:thioredoxin reductase (NADPH)